MSRQHSKMWKTARHIACYTAPLLFLCACGRQAVPNVTLYDGTTNSIYYQLLLSSSDSTFKFQSLEFCRRNCGTGKWTTTDDLLKCHFKIDTDTAVFRSNLYCFAGVTLSFKRVGANKLIVAKPWQWEGISLKHTKLNASEREIANPELLRDKDPVLYLLLKQ